MESFHFKMLLLKEEAVALRREGKTKDAISVERGIKKIEKLQKKMAQLDEKKANMEKQVYEIYTGIL